MKNKQDQLQKAVDKIVEGIDESFAILEDELSHPAKSFTILYEDKFLELHTPTTKQEYSQMRFDRAQFIEYLLKNAIDVTLCAKVQELECDYAFDDLFGVINGEDPASHQFEKYEEVLESSDEVNRTGQHRTIPINMDNYQVKENLGLLDEQINKQD